MTDPQMPMAPAVTRDVARERSLFADVYTWMTIGLLVTAVTAFAVASSPDLVMTVVRGWWFFLLGELALVWILSASINRLSAVAATTMFVAYSALNGVTLSLILLIYTMSTVQLAFFATAGTFAVMSVYGRVTKADLSSMGNLLFMGLLGLIVASVVNVFWANSTMDWIITYAGILIFTGLTAYDTQKIKQMSYEISGGGELTQKVAIMGALRLYLDFINLFLFMLRLLGRRD